MLSPPIWQASPEELQTQKSKVSSHLDSNTADSTSFIIAFQFGSLVSAAKRHCSEIDIWSPCFLIKDWYEEGNEDHNFVHDALEYGDCHLSLAIPKYGIFENINSLKELARMPQWTAEKPLRVATGFTYFWPYPSAQLGPKFIKENGIKYVTFSTADGALIMVDEIIGWQFLMQRKVGSYASVFEKYQEKPESFM
nr:atp phosphoribosyltransferase 2, chloroplastic [Quercus suber]